MAADSPDCTPRPPFAKESEICIELGLPLTWAEEGWIDATIR